MDEIEKKMSESEEMTIWFDKSEQELLQDIQESQGLKNHVQAVFFLLQQYATIRKGEKR